MTRIWIACCLLLGGCHRAVRVPVSIEPAVALPSNTVAVVTVDRECRSIADALATRLGRSTRVIVNPRSPVRLYVSDCGTRYETHVLVEQRASAENSGERRRTTVQGRMHAVVQVSAAGHTLANLIGTATHEAVGRWAARAGDERVLLRTTVEHTLLDRISDDLAGQVTPVSHEVSRRYYTNPPRGSARQLHNLAVRAELAGDTSRARDLAHAAWLEDPTRGRRAYVDELEAILNLTR